MEPIARMPRISAALCATAEVPTRQARPAGRKRRLQEHERRRRQRGHARGFGDRLEIVHHFSAQTGELARVEDARPGRPAYWETQLADGPGTASPARPQDQPIVFPGFVPRG